jgi:hypothetical protein
VAEGAPGVPLADGKTALDPLTVTLGVAAAGVVGGVLGD